VSNEKSLKVFEYGEDIVAAYSEEDAREVLGEFYSADDIKWMDVTELTLEQDVKIVFDLVRQALLRQSPHWDLVIDAWSMLAPHYYESEDPLPDLAEKAGLSQDDTWDVLPVLKSTAPPPSSCS